ncbi:MAG: type II CRISPR-associated endonuclease Cas1 [Culicoidibacterales bacterium]
MSWRTVIVTKKGKLSYQQNTLILRDEEITSVHLSEIQTLIIENNQVTITMQLLNELIKAKINVVFCDERHMPLAQMQAFYGSHDTSRKYEQQIAWQSQRKQQLWQKIVMHKIINQAEILHRNSKVEEQTLMKYLEHVEAADQTNREAQAAKVYWHSLFGKAFHREEPSHINSALDYGYTILLSCFAREIVAQGYATQLGINHHNKFNEFNLASDLMEPFRVLVDTIVWENRKSEFNREYKYKLVNVLNKKVKIKGKEYYLNAGGVAIYLKGVFEYLNNEAAKEIFEIELME